ncbi:MAG: GNAT family N-acetyltransferase [Gammaproteobacteria bacterium]|nr:GNAT family N-acetyltransferase [Gammaproteobacteria bacterium]
MRVRVHDSIRTIRADAWNALTGTQIPFLRHEYFAALEASGSLASDSGWTACYLTVEDPAGELSGAVPLFEKSDSRGEFIFDWAWAAAMQRAGRSYYPKLVAAIPFTPVPGRRCLFSPHAEPGTAAVLIEAARKLAGERSCSSLHWLFVTEPELNLIENSGCVVRTGCDFVWRNPGVADFEAWLDTLTSRSRKKIRRERRRVHDAGIACVWRDGQELGREELDVIYQLYSVTYYTHGMLPYLRSSFFAELATRLPHALKLCFAYRDGDILACAVFLQDGTTLYGRYWGASEWINSLHFELCYYQGIAHALKHGLQYFHPGVQGEHKLLRGFEPTLHYSAHWLRDPELGRAVAGFLDRERDQVENYIAEAETFLPYRRDPGQDRRHRKPDPRGAVAPDASSTWRKP